MDDYNHLTDTFKDIVVIVHLKKLRSTHIWINTNRNMDEYGEVSGNDSDSCFASSKSWDYTPGLKSSSQQLTRCSGSFARMKIPNDERETGWSSDGLMKSIEIQNLVGFSMFFPGSRSLFGYLLSKLHDAWFI